MIRGGPGRRQRILTVPTENGLLSFSNGDEMIGRTLYVRRSWEIDLIRSSIGYLREQGHIGAAGGDVVLDVGANVGMIAIGMLKHGYFRAALAFEPAAANFALLERNIRQNEMAGAIRAYHCALSDSSSEMTLELSGENFGDHRLRMSALPAPGEQNEQARQTVSVPVRTLDEVLAETGAVPAERIDLVWVDIQGHEGQFLRGARATLAHGMPMVSELWPYGIRRAGLDAGAFTEIAAESFTHFVRVEPEAGLCERHPITALPQMFDAYPSANDLQEVIFLSDRRGR